MAVAYRKQDNFRRFEFQVARGGGKMCADNEILITITVLHHPLERLRSRSVALTRHHKRLRLAWKEDWRDR